MMHSSHPDQRSIIPSTPRIIPEPPSHHRRESVSKYEHEGEIPPMLPPHHGVFTEIAHVGATRFDTRLDDLPANMTVEHSFQGGVRIELGVGVAVV
jgi:hypothetical protein